MSLQAAQSVNIELHAIMHQPCHSTAGNGAGGITADGTAGLKVGAKIGLDGEADIWRERPCRLAAEVANAIPGRSNGGADAGAGWKVVLPEVQGSGMGFSCTRSL